MKGLHEALGCGPGPVVVLLALLRDRADEACEFGDPDAEVPNGHGIVEQAQQTNHICIITCTFIDVFNKTIKYKLIKYMELHITTNWSDFLQPVLTAYSNTKHSAAGVSPNDVNSKNEMQIAMELRSKAKTGSYPDVNEGDTVRIQMIHKTSKGFKQQWSTE